MKTTILKSWGYHMTINKEGGRDWGTTVEDQTCHLIGDSASKSFRLSAMLIDSSIRGSFFCRDTSRCNTFQSPIENSDYSACSRGHRNLSTIRFSVSSPVWLCMQQCSFLCSTCAAFLAGSTRCSTFTQSETHRQAVKFRAQTMSCVNQQHDTLLGLLIWELMTNNSHLCSLMSSVSTMMCANNIT